MQHEAKLNTKKIPGTGSMGEHFYILGVFFFEFGLLNIKEAVI